MKAILLCALALSIGLPTLTAPASAAPKRVEGSRCSVSHATRGTWVGYFSGYEADPIISFGDDRRRNITVWRCFKTKADCTAWKYWMQTDYLAGGQTTWCRRK